MLNLTNRVYAAGMDHMRGMDTISIFEAEETYRDAKAFGMDFDAWRKAGNQWYDIGKREHQYVSYCFALSLPVLDNLPLQSEVYANV